MCVTCGCADDGQATFTRPSLPDQMPADGSETVPWPANHGSASALAPHRHTLTDGTAITHSHGQSPLQQGTTLTLEQAILGKNDQIAAENRVWLRDRAIAALNLVSGPGAGKTTLLVQTLQDLQGEMPLAVIEGDQATSQDGDRVAATGCPTLQVNTGKGCHLDAAMVQRGLHDLNPPEHALVMIENVGNLVCPALFDLGEQAKVALLSVTEGEDKPIKYPHLFRASQVLVLTKIDLLPYVPFDRDRCLAYARQVNPDLTVFEVSALSGAGLGPWYDWLRSRVQ